MFKNILDITHKSVYVSKLKQMLKTGQTTQYSAVYYVNLLRAALYINCRENIVQDFQEILKRINQNLENLFSRHQIFNYSYL